MRRPVRPFFFFALACGLVALSRPTTAQDFQPTRLGFQPAPGDGYNLVLWQSGYPFATTGGAEVSVGIKPTKGWSCTEVTFRAVDDATNKTLDTATFSDPGSTVSWSFNGLGSKVKVRVTANATFQNQSAFDFKDLEEWVTTN